MAYHLPWLAERVIEKFTFHIAQGYSEKVGNQHFVQNAPVPCRKIGGIDCLEQRNPFGTFTPVKKIAVFITREGNTGEFHAGLNIFHLASGARENGEILECHVAVDVFAVFGILVENS